MNLPNLITLARLGLVPFFVWGLETGHAWLACGIFVVASLTDWVDGYLARTLKQTTALGSLLDPLADKVLVAAALVGLVLHDQVPAWSVTLVLSREFLITGLRTAAMHAGVVLAAGMSGKIKTVLQMVAITGLLVPVPTVQGYATWVWWAALVVTVYSAIAYLWQTRGIWR